MVYNRTAIPVIDVSSCSANIPPKPMFYKDSKNLRAIYNNVLKWKEDSVGDIGCDLFIAADGSDQVTVNGDCLCVGQVVIDRDYFTAAQNQVGAYHDGHRNFCTRLGTLHLAYIASFVITPTTRGQAGDQT